MIGLAEFEHRLWNREIELRTQRDGKLPEGPRALEFAELAVDYEAKQLIEKFRSYRKPVTTGNRETPGKNSKREYRPQRFSDDLSANLIFLLAYVHRWKRPLPDSLLEAVAVAVHQNVDAPRGLDKILFPKPGPASHIAGVKNSYRLRFDRAAILYGESEVHGSPISISELAREVDVDRRTIRLWQENPLFEFKSKLAASTLVPAQRQRLSVLTQRLSITTLVPAQRQRLSVLSQRLAEIRHSLPTM